MAMEHEVKARLDDPARLRQVLVSAGAKLRSARVFEDNYLLDDRELTLKRRSQVLRIRVQADETILTWKGPKGRAGAVKSREEIEVAAGDPGRLRDLLTRLGYAVVLRYQKYRDTWELGPVQVMIDDTPAGTFVEIEGEPDDVTRGVERLGIAASDLLEDSYPTLFFRILAERGDGSREMVFPPPGP
jgi:adenylate cyclase class 2